MLGAKRIIKPLTGMCFYLPAQYSLNPRRHQHSDRNLAGTTDYCCNITCGHYRLAHLEVHPRWHGKMVAERSGL